MLWPLFSIVMNLWVGDEWPERGDEGPERKNKGTNHRNEGTNHRNEGTGNEKPYGLVQIEYWDRGTSTRQVWTWRGRVTLYLDV